MKLSRVIKRFGLLGYKLLRERFPYVYLEFIHDSDYEQVQNAIFREWNGQ